MAEKVGILGLGLIGRLTAELIMPHGYECYAVRRPSTEDFPDMGGTLVDTPRELAQACDFLLSALPSVDAARDAFYGDDGVLAGA
ncbi:MAG: 3-hydroxyisobutyrate dehydrogenase-like beta-hydroxyacid dehydrogenase, partial [Alphaproteobacteria bacterium]